MESAYLTMIPAAREIVSGHRIDRKLVADFFMLFARAEYALKRAGYVCEGRTGEPRIKWDDFARRVGGPLFESQDPDLMKAIRHLTDHPPKRQTVSRGSLTWEDRKSADPQDPIFLIRSVRTVRNNLFHGGKEIRGTLVERDRILLKSSLLTLIHAINLEQDVRHAFQKLPPETEIPR